MADEGTDALGGALSFEAQISDQDYLQSIDRMLNANRKLHNEEMKRLDISVKAQREYTDMLLTSGGAFANLSKDTQQQLASLTSLQKEMQRVSAAKEALNTAYASGNTSQATYQAGISKLVEEEQSLATAIANVSAQLAKSDSLRDAGNAAISTRVREIERLEAAYKGMGAAGQNTDAGKALQANMSGLKSEIQGLENAFKSINDNAFGNLAGEVKALDAIQQRYVQIAKLQNDLAQVKTQQVQLQDNFSEKQKSAQEYRLEVAKLAEQEKALQSEINATKATVKASDAQFDASQNKIRAEIKELEKLKAVYAELAKTSPTTPAAKTTASDISRLEKSVQRGQDAETKILEERAAAAAKLEQQYKELNAVKVQKQEIKSSFAGQEKFIIKYREEVERLNIQEKELISTIQQETAAAQANEAIMKAGIVAISQRTAEVAKLQAAFDKLSDVEKADPKIGGAALQDIDKLQSEIRLLKEDVTSLPQLNLGAIEAKTKQVAELDKRIEAIKSSLTGLPSPSFKVESVGDLEKNIAKIDELKAKLAALPEKEQIDINVGGKIREELSQIEAQTVSLVGKVLNIPDLSLGNLDKEVQKLRQLETQLENLSEAEIKAGGAEKLIADIDQAEANVNLLKKAVASVPELNLGNVREKVGELIKLKNAVDAVKSPDFTFGPEIKTEIDASLKSLQELRAALKDIPEAELGGISLAGIDKNITDLQRLKTEIAEIDKIQTQKLELTNNFNGATDDAAQYHAELARLTAAEEKLTQSITANSNALQGNATAQDSSKRNLEETEARLESLRLSYAQLGEAGQQTGKGLAIAKEIDQLDAEVKRLSASLEKVKIGNIETTGLQKVKNDFRDLLAIQDNLAGVKTKKLQLETDYKAAAIDARAYGESLEALEKQETDLTAAYSKQSAELKKNTDFQKAGNEILEQKVKELARVKQSFNNLPNASKLDVNIGGDFKNQINALEAELNQLRAILKKVDGGTFDKSIKETQQFKKSIEQLQIEMQSYEAFVKKATDPAIIKKYTAEIARLEAQIKQVRNAGKDGFDAMGRPLNSQLSILGRLEKAANLYKNAIQNATNPANITKYNQKLEQTNREIQRVQSAGKTGFDAMGNSITKSTNVAGKLFNGLKSIAMFLPGIGLVGLVGLVTEPLLEWIKSLDLFKAKIDEAQEARKSFNDVMVKGSQNAQQEITSLKTLYGITQDTTISTEKRRDAVKELQKQFPDYLGNIKAETILNGGAKEAYDRLSESIIATGRARAAQDKITENASKRIDNEQRLIDLQAEQLKNEQKLARQRQINEAANSQGSTTPGGTGNAFTATQLFNAQKKVSDNLKEQARIRKENEQLDKNSLRLAGAINDQVKKGADLFSDNTAAGSKAIDDYLKRYEDMLQRIQALKDKYDNKSEDPDTAARNALNAEFKKLAFDINQFNKDPKNKIKIDVAPIEELRVKAENRLIYRQETEKLKIETERQKQIFLEYENYKAELGKDKAEERYAGEKAAFDTFKDFLINKIREITSLGIPADKMSAEMKARLENYTKSLEDVNKSDQASYDKFYTDLAQAAQTYYQRLAIINAEYREKEAQLRQRSSGPDLDRELAELEAQKNKKVDIAKDEAFQKTKIYEKLNQAIIRYTKDHARAQIEATKAALKNTDISAGLRKQLEEDLGNFELVLDLGVDATYIKQLQDRKKLLEDSLKTQKLSTAEIRAHQKELAEINGKLQDINLNWKNLFGVRSFDTLEGAASNANLLRNTVGQITQGFRNAANSVREMNGALADSLDTAATIGDIATDYFSAGAAILSGDFGGALTSTLSYLQKAFDFVFTAPKRTAREAKRQLDEYNRQQFDAQFEINQLYRERLRTQLEINAVTMKGIRDQAQALKEQAAKTAQDYQKVLDELLKQQYVIGQKTEKYGGVFGIGQKTRVVDVFASLRGLSFDAIEQLFLSGKLSERAAELFKILQKLREEGADIDALLEENLKAAQELALGISSDAFTDAFANLFNEGRPSIEKLAQFFTDTMSDAALSIFKSEYLADAMSQFYKAFAAAATEDSEAGIVITEAEKAKLKELYESLSKDAIAVYEELLSITGTGKAATGSTEDKNSLKGDISRMTEETGTVLAGQLGGMRLSLLDSVEELRLIRAILAGGQLSIPAAGNTTFNIPGMLEVAENGRLQVGLSQQMVLTGVRQVELMTLHLDLARQTAENTGETAVNTRRLQSMESSLKNMERAITTNVNAVRANGG